MSADERFAAYRTTDNEQPSLLSDEETEAWRKEWVGMPEFVQEKQRAYRQLTVRFASEKDYQAFAALVGQKLTGQTKSLWYPAVARGEFRNARWTGEP